MKCLQPIITQVVYITGLRLWSIKHFERVKNAEVPSVVGRMDIRSGRDILPATSNL